MKATTAAWASIRSKSDNYARAPLAAPLSLKPLCDPATFVAMLRTRAGMDMGWLKDAMCKCNKARVTTEHAMTCPAADLYQMRHNSLLLAMIRLARIFQTHSQPTHRSKCTFLENAITTTINDQATLS